MKLSLLAFASSLIWVSTPLLFAEDTTGTQGTLRGLSGVGLSVIVEENGIPQEGDLSVLLRTEIEMRLRAAGIKVLKSEEWSRMPGSPLLAVTLALHYGETGESQSYAVFIELLQSVSLIRNPTVRNILSPTWSSTLLLGHFESKDIGTLRLKKMRADVQTELEKLIAAWQAVNLKS